MEGKKHFHLHFELPLPKQIIIFSLGKWETHFKGQEIVAEVSVDGEIPPNKIGTLTSSNKALCWDNTWPISFEKKSEEVFEQVLIIILHFLVENSFEFFFFKRSISRSQQWFSSFSRYL